MCVQRDETSGRKLDTDDMRERRVGRERDLESLFLVGRGRAKDG